MAVAYMYRRGKEAEFNLGGQPLSSAYDIIGVYFTVVDNIVIARLYCLVKSIDFAMKKFTHIKHLSWSVFYTNDGEKLNANGTTAPENEV